MDDQQVRLTDDNIPNSEAWLVLLPLLIVLSTFLFLLLLFLVCVLLIRRRRGISLRDHDGPVDMSREEYIEGEGGFEGLESRWLESESEQVRRAYLRAKDYQLQFPPNSLPTDITLSQFLSIQEKGVSAWCFEPDYETVNSLLVHARTEITFLPDPASSSCVQSNLPLPKLNEVYYWEVKMFDLPETTNVAVGLATKPYPAFRLPGLNRYSVAYHSNGDKSHNYPFTASPFGATLKEGDILGVGFRPRTGTVFFTRNGRKMEDAFTSVSRWNMFPTIGADGPCSVHVNLGQSGFVFVEANVKKWGLAPSVGTLAPPPAYGSERGSILLDVGGRIRPIVEGTPQSASSSSSTTPSRRSRRSQRRTRHPSGEVIVSSPLRTAEPITPPPPITPISEESPEHPEADAEPSTSPRYISPTDAPFHAPPNTNLPSSLGDEDDDSELSSPSTSSRSLSPEASAPAAGANHSINPFTTPRRLHHSLTHSIASSLNNPGPSHVASGSGGRHSRHNSRNNNNISHVMDTSDGEMLNVQVHPPPDSPMSPDPPTPNHRDIHLQALTSTRSDHRRTPSGNSVHSNHGEYGVHGEQVGHGTEYEEDSEDDRLLHGASLSRRDPPAYSPLDAFTYADGVHIDLPAEFIQAALEGNAIPASAIGQANASRRERRTTRRR